MRPPTPEAEVLQDCRRAREEARGFLGGEPLPEGARRLQPIPALVPHDFADTIVTAQLHDDPLTPARGGSWVLVEKVPTGLQLEPVDLHSEAQEDHGLGSPPPNLCRAPVAPVEVLNGT